MIDKKELRAFAQIAQKQIDDGVVEDTLRHLLSARFNKIFPDSPWWIQVHVLGTETYVKFAGKRGKARSGFADTVVGKTAIEYERNLTAKKIFDEGYYQVREYCAALYNIGISSGEILGVLSDTVRWFGYSVSVIGTVGEDGLYGAENIKLKEQDSVDLSIDNDIEYEKFGQFVNKYLGRKQSRILNAKTLTLDFGMESGFYSDNIAIFRNVIIQAMTDKPDYAKLIKYVWQNFVAYLGATDYGRFSMVTYVNEFYLVTVAKIICANIMSGEPMISDESEIKKILNGRYFTQQNISNLVDYDYFGWLNESPYVDAIAKSAMKIQRQLIAYDFSFTGEQDLFGELLAQLANREHRLLLGQEFTPHWVAREMVADSLEKLPSDETPCVLDMCCGSGVFLIETIKAVRNKYGISKKSYDKEKDKIAFSCVTGFDIDPLAVMLAKVNWVMAMKDLFSLHHGSITIPIYHADSLFVATPITHCMPVSSLESYVLRFGENEIELPAFLLTPEYRTTFDSFMAKCYKMAMTRAAQDESELTDDTVLNVIDVVERESETVLVSDKKKVLEKDGKGLILQLEHLQREGHNGIWFFILSNSYRPGLVTHQFNCIVSNPPWLAMSKLANNPYKSSLKYRTQQYGIRPYGAAHLHIELATVFLLSSVDKYLKDGGIWGCIMPESLLNGYNHQPLRDEKYRQAEFAVPMKVDTIWELPVTTFKNAAIVLGGRKSEKSNPVTLSGRKYEDDTFKTCEYVLKKQGNRDAWSDKGDNAEVADLINASPWAFQEGADLMPRTALFHTFHRQANGNWSIRRIENTSYLYYLVNDSKKKDCADLVADDFDDEYMYDLLISKHLSPFYVAKPAKGIMPGKKTGAGWKGIGSEDLAMMNAGTNYVFTMIQEKLGINLNKWLIDKINIRGKLVRQNFSLGNWLVLSNAGGSNPCAAYISLDDLDKSRLVIDQTLYWYLAKSEEEAIYLVGLINSRALSNAIRDFQPRGEFGARHIHTLPYKIMPKLDLENPAHIEVIEATKKVISEWEVQRKEEDIVALLQPNSGSLNSRRRRLQAKLRELLHYADYEDACRDVLGVAENEVIDTTFIENFRDMKQVAEAPTTYASGVKKK